MTAFAQSAHIPRNPYLLQLKGCSALSSMSLPRLKISRDLKRSQDKIVIYSRTFQSNKGWRRSEAIYKQHCERFFSARASRPRLQFHWVLLVFQASLFGTNTWQFRHERGQNNPSAQSYANKYANMYLDFKLDAVNPYMILRKLNWLTPQWLQSVRTPNTCRIWIFTNHFHPQTFRK